MADDERIPRFSYDLITILDTEIASPTYPNTANGFAAMTQEAVRAAAFTAGARSIVDWLIDWRGEQDEHDAEIEEDGSIPDGPDAVFPRVFDGDGDVREDISPVRMARELSE